MELNKTFSQEVKVLQQFPVNSEPVPRTRNKQLYFNDNKINRLLSIYAKMSNIRGEFCELTVFYFQFKGLTVLYFCMTTRQIKQHIQRLYP